MGMDRGFKKRRSVLGQLDKLVRYIEGIASEGRLAGRRFKISQHSQPTEDRLFDDNLFLWFLCQAGLLVYTLSVILVRRCYSQFQIRQVFLCNFLSILDCFIDFPLPRG